MESALVQAYQNNPQLNAQRASARVTDEAVPQALSGYRPRASVTATLGEQYSDVTTRANSQGINTYARSHATTTPYSGTGTVSQTLFNGFQTANRTRVAESQVSAAREGLRIMEQTVLLAAATAYMDVLRDTANLEVQRTNVRVLEETLKQTRDRFNVGEVTRTDVAQAEAQLAAGQSAVAASESILNTSRANYRQVVGTEAVNLAPGSPVDRFSPRVLSAAIDNGLSENPNVTSAMYGVDVAHLQVKINEGALFPNLSLQGNVQYASFPQLSIVHQFSTSVIGQLTVPLYQGGGEFSLIRQSKESLSQQRLNLDQVRNQTRQAVVQAPGRQGSDRGRAIPGRFLGSGAQRRPRGSPRRPAHHARRAQCPAGSGERPRSARHRAARSRGRLLQLARRGGQALAAGARVADQRLRPDGPLSAGARCLDRHSQPRRALNWTLSAIGARGRVHRPLLAFDLPRAMILRE